MKDIVEVQGVNGETKHVPLVDIYEVLTEHEKEYTMETSKGALVFKMPSAIARAQVNAKFKQFLREYFIEAVAQAQKIMQKDPKDRTDKEDEFLTEFALRSRPYQIEMNYIMLVKPKMRLDQWEQFIEALPEIDWIAIQLHCRGILDTNLEELKNSDPPPSG